MERTDQLAESATALHRNAMVLDMVLPLIAEGSAATQLLKRFAVSGHDFVSLTIAGDHDSCSSAVHRLARVRAFVRKNPDFVLVEGVEDIVHAKATGKLAIGLHLEGSNCMERDLDMVEAYYDLGIRQCIPAFNLNNSASGGCADLADCGLTKFGVRLLDRMQEVGMLIDLSHTGYRSSMQTMERATRPVIFSHSNAAKLVDHYRNLRDDQIIACARTGGVVGISGANMYLGVRKASAEAILRHIEYVIEIAGPDHVGLGIDYVSDISVLSDHVLANPDEWPDLLGLGTQTPDYSPPEQLPELTEMMLRRGYDEMTIRGVLGANFLRACRATWR